MRQSSQIFLFLKKQFDVTFRNPVESIIVELCINSTSKEIKLYDGNILKRNLGKEILQMQLIFFFF